MENHQLLDQLSIYLQRLGYQEDSVRIIKRASQEFITQMDINQIESLEDVTPSDIIDHYNYLNERPNKTRSGGLSSKYIEQQMYSLKVFFEWLQIAQLIVEHPMSSLDFPTGQSAPMQILTTDEIQLLYEACESWKEKTLLSIYYGCGLRRTEGERLDLSDVHFGSGILYVRKGKGSKRRAVPMSKKVAEPIYNYIYKERFNPLKSKALVINKYGRRTRGASWGNLLKKLISKTTIEKDISLHCLRHSIATHLLASGMNLQKIQNFLGHRNLESTMIYTRVSKSMIHDIT